MRSIALKIVIFILYIHSNQMIACIYVTYQRQKSRPIHFHFPRRRRVLPFEIIFVFHMFLIFSFIFFLILFYIRVKADFYFFTTIKNTSKILGQFYTVCKN